MALQSAFSGLSFLFLKQFSGFCLLLETIFGFRFVFLETVFGFRFVLLGTRFGSNFVFLETVLQPRQLMALPWRRTVGPESDRCGIDDD